MNNELVLVAPTDTTQVPGFLVAVREKMEAPDLTIPDCRHLIKQLDATIGLVKLSSIEQQQAKRLANEAWAEKVQGQRRLAILVDKAEETHLGLGMEQRVTPKKPLELAKQLGMNRMTLARLRYFSPRRMDETLLEEIKRKKTSVTRALRRLDVDAAPRASKEQREATKIERLNALVAAQRADLATLKEQLTESESLADMRGQELYGMNERLTELEMAFDSNDQTKELNALLKQKEAEIVRLKELLTGAESRAHAATTQAKTWQRKHDRAQKAMKNGQDGDHRTLQ